DALFFSITNQHKKHTWNWMYVCSSDYCLFESWFFVRRSGRKRKSLHYRSNQTILRFGRRKWTNKPFCNAEGSRSMNTIVQVRNKQPLIHHLRNQVVMNFTANGLLAFGGRLSWQKK